MIDLVSLPKAELHIHIEGTLEPELMFTLAKRNGVDLPFPSIEEVRASYRFTDLQSFLDIYYQGAAALQTEQDFHDLMAAYLTRAKADGVRRAEIFFDPQTHTLRGIPIGTVLAGFRAAIADSEISTDLILCFLRHLPAADALATIEDAADDLEGIIAVGLDSSEVGNPPELFEEAYDRARQLGLRAVAHAGEEGPPSYIAGALDVLGAERIDHGIRSLEDQELTARLRALRTPLTVCPLSNLALRVVDSLADHPLPTMMESGLLVSINSDDPAFFGGYVGENFRRAREALALTDTAVVQLAANSIESSFLDQGSKATLLAEIDQRTA